MIGGSPEQLARHLEADRKAREALGSETEQYPFGAPKQTPNGLFRRPRRPLRRPLSREEQQAQLERARDTGSSARWRWNSSRERHQRS